MKLLYSRFYLIYGLLLFTFSICKCFGQRQNIFKKIDQSSGLSNSRITGIIKEKNGFFWIGTQNGLNKFDGSEIKVYNKQNSNIGSNDISEILLDSKGRIIVATNGGGFSFYDKEKDAFKVYKNIVDKNNDAVSNQVNTIIEDTNGDFWLGTEKGLVYFSFDNNEFVHYTYNLHNINISSIYEDKNNKLWLGTFNNGLLLFDTYSKEFKKITDNNNQELKFIEVISELNSDKILVGTFGDGLILVDIKTHKFSNFFKENLSLKKRISIVRSIKRDSKNNLWIGTDGFGLFEIQYPNSKEPIVKNYMYNPQLKASLSGNSVYEIFEDEDSNIWIGTAWNGINILDTKKTTELLFSDIFGINPSPVLSIYKNTDKLFLGLDGNGLSINDYQKNKVQILKNTEFSQVKYVQKISKINEDNLWLGTFNNGLIKLDINTKKIKSYKNILNKNSISYNDVRDIIIEDNGNLWVSTWGGGLNYFDTKNNNFINYSQDLKNNLNTLNNNNLISLEKDENKIWISTFGGGLNVYDIQTKQFTHIISKEKDSSTISSNYVFSLLKDSKENLWVGTSGEGINRINLKTYKTERFAENIDIRFSTITSIIEDNENNIWFGSKDGIIKFDYKSETFNKFPQLNGEFHINSVFKDELGFLYFGGIDGVLKFHPKDIKAINSHPKVKFTNFKLFNKELKIDKNGILKKNIELLEDVILEHDHNVVTFEFSALEFPFSNNSEYAILMENFDEEWRDIGKDRTATYTNLSPGDYIFKVKSKTLGSTWGDDFTSIKIKILKPFWLAWWALAIYIFVFLGLFYLFRKYIIAWGKLKSSFQLEKYIHEKDNELNQLKQQFFTNISHEIRTPVTLILSSINRLFDKGQLVHHQQIKSAYTIRKSSNQLLKLVNEILDFKKLGSNTISLKKTNEEFVSFVKEIFLSFSEIASDRNIKYTFHTDEKTCDLRFDKNQIEKVIYNLLTNAFKFTKNGGEIKVKVENSKSHVYFSVADNGIGIDPKYTKKIFERFYQIEHTESEEKAGFGLGLSLSKDIIELHNGTITVDSVMQLGSTFKIKLEKNKEKLNNDSEHSQIENITNQTIKKLRNKTSKKKDTILIVEDNVEIQDMLNSILTQEFNIIKAYNGLEGLKKAISTVPDLIISDVMMPEMDGIEFSKKVKLNTITSHIPIIILTAKTSFIDKMAGTETGADEYITKPFNEDFLIVKINNLLNNRKILRKKFNAENLLNPKELPVSSMDQSFLENLYKHLEQNLQSNNLKADTISKLLNMSHSGMYKKIKALTGLTYIEFIRDYRLSVAKQLIEEMGYSVSDACFKVGYSDRKYFSKLFKQKFKKNPSDFLSAH